MLPIGLPSNTYDKSLVESFRQGLRDVGIVENRDVTLDIVWSSGDLDVAVNELIQRGVELLVPCGSSASAAASRRTSTIPIVFINVGNPVGLGIVESLSRPGRNVTGFSDVLADLSGKYVELARELGGQQATVDYLWHTEWPDGQRRHDATEQAAQSLGAEIRSWGIKDVAGLDDAVAAIKKSGASTFIIQPSPFTYTQRARVIDAANKYRLGTIYGFPIAARDGALVAYGRGANQVRDGDQSQDRRGARAGRAEHHARSRRRGDRIAEPFAAMHMSQFGPKRTSRQCSGMSAFGGKADIEI
jgi:putative ABC transport system substrate-binding protein